MRVSVCSAIVIRSRQQRQRRQRIGNARIKAKKGIRKTHRPRSTSSGAAAFSAARALSHIGYTTGSQQQAAAAAAGA